MEVKSLYMEFLKANYSNVASRLEALSDTKPSGNTPEEIAKSKAALEVEFNSLANDPERLHKFQVWENVPVILRDRYNGRVPPEIMEASERDEIYVLREMEYHPEKKNIDEVRKDVENKYSGISVPEDIVTTAAKGAFVAAIVSGYGVVCSEEMARQHQIREELFERMKNGHNLSEKEKAQIRRSILASRQETANIMRASWGGGFVKQGDKIVEIKPNQPEKMLMHMLREFNAGHIDKDQLVDVMAYLQPHIKNRQVELLEYLHTRGMQARIRSFKDETRDLLSHYVLKELPDEVRSKAMEHIKKYAHGKDLSKEQQAMAVAKNMSATKANVLPQNSKLSTNEKMANMPSALNRSAEREV